MWKHQISGVTSLTIRVRARCPIRPGARYVKGVDMAPRTRYGTRSRRRRASRRWSSRPRAHGLRRRHGRGARRRVWTGRGRMLALASVLLAALVIVGAVFRIGPFPAGARPVGHPRWEIVVTGASTESRPALPAEVRRQLKTAALDDGTVDVLAADGDGTVHTSATSLAPMRG